MKNSTRSASAIKPELRLNVCSDYQLPKTEVDITLHFQLLSISHLLKSQGSVLLLNDGSGERIGLGLK